MSRLALPQLSLVADLEPLAALGSQRREALLADSQVLGLEPGEWVFREGETDGDWIYLLDGELELSCQGRQMGVVAGGTEQARTPLARLTPRQLSARTRTACVVLRIDGRTVGRELEALVGPGERLEVSHIDDDDAVDWMTRMLKSQLFARLPAANIQRVFALLEHLHLKRGEVVIEQGGPGDAYYIIQSGRCVVTRTPSGFGKPIRLSELGEGDTFGEEALLSDAPRNATVTMESDGVLMRLAKAPFLDLVARPIIQSVDFAGAGALVEAGALWLDVRFPEEHRERALPASVNVPVGALRMRAPRLGRGKPYIVYCDNGDRSAIGTFLLVQHGIEAYHLAGGLLSVAVAETAYGAAESVGPQDLEDPLEQATAAPASAPSRAGDNGSDAPPVAEASAVGEPPPAAPARPTGEPALPPAVATSPAPAGATAVVAASVPASPTAVESDVAAAGAGATVPVPAPAAPARGAPAATPTPTPAPARKRAAARNTQLAAAEAQAASLRAELERTRDELKGALREAERLRQEVDAARQKAAAEEQQKLRDRETLVRSRAEVEQKLREEKARLEADFARTAEELAKVHRLRESTEQRLRDEQSALERRSRETERRLEEALRLKAEAEAARRAMVEAMEDSLRSSREQLEAEGARAEMALREVERLRSHVEEARAAARDEAERKRAREKELDEFKRRTEERLRQEEARLQEEYRRHEEELGRVRRAKEAAEARVREEREQLKSESEAAHARLEEARRMQQAAETMRREAAEETRRRFEALRAMQVRIAERAKAVSEAERQQLEASYAKEREALRVAQLERQAADEAREVAESEAEQVYSRYRTALKDALAEEKLRLRSEREHLESEAERVQSMLDDIHQFRSDPRAGLLPVDERERRRPLVERAVEQLAGGGGDAKLEIDVLPSLRGQVGPQVDLPWSSTRRWLTSEDDRVLKPDQVESIRRRLKAKAGGADDSGEGEAS